MLEAILQSLRDVDGVQGAMIVDHAANVVAHRAHSIYDLATLQQVARSIIKAADSVQLIQDDWDTLTTHFGDGKLVLRSVRLPGARPRRYVLTVIADGTLNVAFLGVALRVAASKLTVELEASPVPATPSVPAASSASAASSAPAAQSSAAPRTMPGSVAARATAAAPSPPELAQAGVTWASESMRSTVDTADLAVADAASAAFLSACTRALAASIGPVAKVYVRDAVRKLCGGRGFSRGDGPALIAQLSAMLDSEDDRAMFQRATRSL